MLPDFKLYYIDIVIKTVWYWCKNRHIDHWNRIEFRYKSIFTWSFNLPQKSQKYIMGKNSLFSKWCWENWTSTYERMKGDHFLVPYSNLKMDSRLKYKTKPLRVLEENIGSTVWHHFWKHFFLYLSPQLLTTKAKS